MSQLLEALVGAALEEVRRQAGHSAEAVVRAGARLAVPVHWGTLFPLGMRRAMRHHLAEPGRQFLRCLEELTGDSGRGHLLPVGGFLDLE